MALQLVTAGESHGPALAAIVTGRPAGLRVERPAGRLVFAVVADFCDHRVAGIVKPVRNHTEVIPFRADAHEQLLHQLVVSDPWLAAWLVRVRFRFAP